MLGLALDAWNNVMVSSLGVAAIAAVVVVVSTFAVVRLTKQEAEDAQRDLEAYKLTVEGKVADAKREGIEAGKAAGDALLRAASLEKQAEELKKANLELEAQIQPRRVSGANLQKMMDELSKVRPQPVAVVSRILDAEGQDFGDDLENALKGAKWQTVRFSNWLCTDKGVFIATVEGTPMPPEIESAIAAALDAAKIEHKTITISGEDINRMSPHFQSNVLYLLVGVKP